LRQLVTYQKLYRDALSAKCKLKFQAHMFISNRNHQQRYSSIYNTDVLLKYVAI